MTRPSILSLGECMVELSPDGPGRFKQSFAGDTFNTAWYLRRVLADDWRVGYATCVGHDALSDAMVAFMEASRIDTSAIRRVTRRTVGLYMIHRSNGERSFTYWRSESAARELAADPAFLTTAMEGQRLIYFSGITLAILSSAGRSSLLNCLRAVRAAGSTVAFDPNLRPALWDDLPTMRTTITEAASGADIILPSFDDEQHHFYDRDPHGTIARYRTVGADAVIVKNGAGPVAAWDRLEGMLEHHPKAVIPNDTTAAGDSFNAGFLAARLQGRALRPAIKAGAELAARVVQCPGALVDI